MDELGNRLTDETIKDLFKEKSPFLNEELCNLFRLKMSIFEKYLPPESAEDEMSLEEVDRLYNKHFVDYDPEAAKRQTLEDYKAKIPVEKLREIEEKFAEKVVVEQIPTTYTSNSTDEEILIKMAKVFQKQYQYLFPMGPRNFLVLPNEHDVPKIVCTTLCSLFCSRHEFRMLEKCSAFVADYLDYVPLEAPKNAPSKLDSPAATLKKRIGNSLDFATLLCSLLLSAGYDAYVVQGYCLKDICEKKETQKPCPDFSTLIMEDKYAEYRDENLKVKRDWFETNKYNLLSQGPDLDQKKSVYLEMLEDQKRAEESKLKSEWDEEVMKRFDEVDRITDSSYGQRVHFWVLVMSGKLGIDDTFFIESTTGDKMSCQDYRYKSIEFVWNNMNFWVNKQKSDQTNSKIDFDFTNEGKWDYFLPEDTIPMTPTWVRRSDITYEDYHRPLPRGTKVIIYNCAKVQKFNSFYCPDGCSVRVTYFSDDECEKTREIQEFFKHRDDSLVWRKTDLVMMEVTEMFKEGRDDGLKNHFYSTDRKKTKRVLSYYPFVRPDGLEERTITLHRVVDVFSNRKDFLLRREVTHLERKRKMSREDSLKSTESHSGMSENNKLEDHHETEGLAQLSPLSFQGFDVLLEDVDFTRWKFSEFYNLIDPIFRVVESDDEDDISIGASDIEIAEESLSEETLETNYKLWLNEIKEEIEEAKETSLNWIYEELAEEKPDLKAKKRLLRKKMHERSAAAMALTEGHDDTSSKQLLKSKPIEVKPTDAIAELLEIEVTDIDAEKAERLTELYQVVSARKWEFRSESKDFKTKRRVVEIAKTYGRNPDVHSQLNVKRKRFLIDEGRYCIIYHPPDDRITSRGILFTKPVLKSLYHNEWFEFSDEMCEEILPGYQVKPFRKLNLYKALLQLMKDEPGEIACASAIDEEVSLFVEMRQNEELKLTLVPDIADTKQRDETKIMREKEFLEEVYKACKEQEKSDYLTPAFGIVGFKLPLDRARAERAYRYMIEDYVNSINSKLDLLQTNREKTMEEFSNLKYDYESKDPDQMPISELRSFRDSIGECHSLIGAYLMRSQWIEKPALRDYVKLKKEMKKDPRLQPYIRTRKPKK